MKRVVVPELLDEGDGTPEQVTASLADLRMLNRHFGGSSTTVALLRRVAERSGLRHLSYIDVGGATGDVAAAAQSRLSHQGIELEAVILDRAVSHLHVGSGQLPISGSAFQLPFRDKSFDVVGCSLFLHHLEPAEIVTFLHEAMRVARRAVVINDLRRSRVHWLAAIAGRVLYRSPITRHDAPVSVRRAYTSRELAAILRQAGYPAVEFSRHFFSRMGVILWSGAAR